MDREKRISDQNTRRIIKKTARKVGKSVGRRVDGYLEGTYDPKKEVRKLTVRGVTTSIVVLSLLTGLAFSNPSEIIEDQNEAVNYKPTPVVMDVDDFVNAPVEDDEDDADEQTERQQNEHLRQIQTGGSYFASVCQSSSGRSALGSRDSDPYGDLIPLECFVRLTAWSLYCISCSGICDHAGTLYCNG